MSLSFDLAPDEVQIFLEETEEQLDLLDRAVVDLESRCDDAELLQSIFRAAHTLKGSAGLIRHARMTDVTHGMETILDKLRQGQLKVTPVLVDALLASVDMLRSLKDEVVTLKESDIDVLAVVEWLRQLDLGEVASESGVEPVAQEPRSLSPEAQERIRDSGGGEVYEVSVTIEPDSIAPAARMFQLTLALQELGEIFESWPSEEEILGGCTDTSFVAVVASDRSAEVLEAALAEVSEVASVKVRPRTLETGSAEEEPEAPAATVPSRPDVGAAAPSETRVRIGIDQLDRLMNLTGELVVNRARLLQVEHELDAQQGGAHVGELAEVTNKFSRVIDQLHEEVMRARMVPVDSLFSKFPRLVRDVSRRLNKQVDLEISGQDTELDRSVIEAIRDPLIHLLRNAVDHGIEPPEDRIRCAKPAEGTIWLKAEQRDGHILISVGDDGEGIDPDNLRRGVVEKGVMTGDAANALTDQEAIELVFLSGVSTAGKVTDVSGRGVGLDIVRTNVERLNGSIEVHTTVGEGTTFELALPLTLAIIPAMLVAADDNVFGVPLSSVVEAHPLQRDQIHTVEGNEVICLRDLVLPLLRLRKLLELDGAGAASNGEQLVVIRWGRVEAGMVVDGLVGIQQVVIKSLGSLLRGIGGLAGGSVLGSGQVAFILDVADLIRIAARR